MRVAHRSRTCPHGTLRLKGLLHATAWLAAASMLSACGPHGPSVAAVARALPEALEAPPSPLAPDRGLRTRPGSSPQRVASVRMTERARRLLRSGNYARALTELEKSLSTDGSNPYAHYYIAVAHYRMGNFRASLDFLEVAEPILGHNRPWLVQTLVLRGDNLRALGRFGPAEAAYRRALSMDPVNPSANRGLLWSGQRSKAKSW